MAIDERRGLGAIARASCLQLIELSLYILAHVNICMSHDILQK